MPRTLEHSQLPALALGFSLLGSGGGGTTTVLELALADASAWPITIYDIDELDPALPCFGAAFVGSTMLLAEHWYREAKTHAATGQLNVGTAADGTVYPWGQSSGYRLPPAVLQLLDLERVPVV